MEQPLYIVMVWYMVHVRLRHSYGYVMIWYFYVDELPQCLFYIISYANKASVIVCNQQNKTTILGYSKIIIFQKFDCKRIKIML
jgi:hypothetical protein